MRWFGPAPFSNACIDTPHAPTPIATCVWCEEPFAEDDSGYLVPHMDGGPPTEHAYHPDCWQRQITGSVAHIEHRCACYGGSEEDPPGMTRREAATAAVEAFDRRMRNGETTE